MIFVQQLFGITYMLHSIFLSSTNGEKFKYETQLMWYAEYKCNVVHKHRTRKNILEISTEETKQKFLIIVFSYDFKKKYECLDHL